MYHRSEAPAPQLADVLQSAVELRTNADAADAARRKVRHRSFVANTGQNVDRRLDVTSNLFDICKRHECGRIV